jgi:hypothetical protein
MALSIFSRTVAMSSGPADLRAKSPLAAAVAISLGIAAGAVLSTLDAPIFDEITSGRWLTRSFSQAQERNTAAIAKVERDIGAAASDIDFLAARVAAAIQRNEDATQDRFAEIDARFAALKERIVQASPMARAPEVADAGDIVGLRKSLHDLAASQTGAVAEINKRLNRIERLAGISTDVISSANPARRAARHRIVKNAEPPHAEPAQSIVPTAGHIFDVKPVSQQTAPLRLSRLRD